jgi:aspartyl-tRNA(Asn)/glutamyl-tRNA(Gln) amidotransferase subunit B
MAAASQARSSLFRGSWAVRIGLEIHAQLKVNSKIFSNTVALANLGPNQAVSLFDAAYPGTLPVLNRAFVSQSVKAALALNCQVNPQSSFERKHYFYLDLPLGYQITQYSSPVASNGLLHYRYYPAAGDGDSDKQGQQKQEQQKIKLGTVRIDRIQMEQDSGKSIHDLHDEYSLVDLNRAGTGLIEIVFMPDIESPEQAAAVLRSTQEILRYIDVCDGNLETGGMRCDVNVSVHKIDDSSNNTLSQTLGKATSKRVEIKNLNSMQRVRDAATFEANRLIDLLEAGQEITQETRGYDPIRGITYSSREKETDVDYRYLPDPDLPGVLISNDEIENIRAMMEELPVQAMVRLQTQYGLNESCAENLVNKQGSAYFENAWKKFCELTADVSATAPAAADEGGKGKGGKKAKIASADSTAFYFWITGELQGHLNVLNVPYSKSPLTAPQMGKILSMLQTGKLSAPQTKNIIAAYFSPKYLQNASEVDPEDLAKAENMLKVTDENITREYCTQSLNAHPVEWNNFLTDKGRMINFFLGDVLKLSKGTLDPPTVLKVLNELKSAHLAKNS